MVRYWPVIELLTFLNFFGTTLLEIIAQKHIYNSTVKDHADFEQLNCCETSDDASYGSVKDPGLISAATEHWLLYKNLASLLVAIPSTILLGIWSEAEGRKNVLVATLIGIALRAALFTIIIKFKAPLYFFAIASLITSAVGYNTSFMASCMAYMADITSSGQRTLKIVFIDCVAGIGIGLASFISGFYLESEFFNNFLWLIMAIMIFNIFCVVFSLETNVFIHELIPICKCSYFVGMWKIFSHDPGNGRRWRLVTYSTALFIGGMVFYGTNYLILFHAQTSLCFSLILMAFLSASLALRYIVSLAFVKLFQTILKMANSLIIESGLLSIFAGLIVAAFSKTMRVLFIVPAFQFLGGMPLSVMKASLSRLVEPQEQGTLFAVVSCLEASAAFLGVNLFNQVYDGTHDIFGGLPFLIGAMLLIVPGCLVGFLHKNEDATSRYLFFPEESECDFGQQCTISVRSKSAPKIVSVPVVPHEDFIVVHHQNECETSNQATNGCLMPV
ncbi:proton-coupled folate transporter-like isoform X1 [Stylophora pistillata]|uniref:Proton-coupled folate transporter n=2 Tax=Stylophora pistillata TaxID=50429 RepID=A0A2B4SSR5_STYPI|nr:proton-coupled folate transporter-like isoform X1 [Stylophora pistillata]XP_022780774.1 proton-coupled folate transporter-like isoform X1 [Stylophora pistillata]XP_022780775.1 proton-coupled folate transporter-like isoform X1 [Stylophora pistillata]PFX31592.1 Proton-coupled folate transporter [Stylophora pistillata]